MTPVYEAGSHLESYKAVYQVTSTQRVKSMKKSPKCEADRAEDYSRLEAVRVAHVT